MFRKISKGIDMRRFKARLMLMLALLKELKIRTDNNIDMVRHSRERLLIRVKVIEERLGRKYAARFLREAKSYEALEIHLSYVSALLERLILRLETLTITNSLVEAAILASKLIQELKKSVVYGLPQFSVIVDELEKISRDLVEASKNSGYTPRSDVVSEEARRILEEAKVVASSREHR